MDERICYFFSFLIEGIVFWNYVSILFVPKCSAKIRFVCLSFGFFILFLFSLHNIFLLNCILYTTVCFLYLIFLYKTSWYYALFHSLLFTHRSLWTSGIQFPVYFFYFCKPACCWFSFKASFCRYQQNSLFCCNVGTSVMVEETPKTFFTVW